MPPYPQGKELLVLLFAVGVLIFAVANRPSLRKLPAWRLLWASFCILLAGWTLGVLESLPWPGIMRVFERLCYAGSSLLLAVWCWAVFVSRREKSYDAGGHSS